MAQSNIASTTSWKLEDAGRRRNRLATTCLVIIASLLSLAAFLYPFILPGLFTAQAATARGVEAPLILAFVTALCLVVLLTQLSPHHQRATSSAKVAALLGAVVAIDASLRLLPSLGGASPVFLLIILAGSVFGAQFGFLTGTLTLFLSAFLTGGIGPWLPFQMIGAGWIGLAAAWVPRPRCRRRRLAYLTLYGIGSGFLYGALLSLYSWPFAAPGLVETSSLFWNPGLGLSETVHRYASFYLVTSLGHDALRAFGNGFLLLILGSPLLRTLERARRRLFWQQSLAPVTSLTRRESSQAEPAVR